MTRQRSGLAMGRSAGLVLGLVAGLALLPAVAAAQVGDPRTVQMQEQLRQMRGQIEELNYLLLQMQEQMRRQQEDNEFRLQQLEDQLQGAVQQPASGGDQQATVSPPAAGAPEIAAPEPSSTPAAPPPIDLGTIRIDGQGNVTGAGIDGPSIGANASRTGEPAGPLSGPMNAQELYRTGYQHALDGDYALAEEVFERFGVLYPNDVLAPDAGFWLGESVLAQGRFQDAADIFIENRTRYPQSGKAAETMFKIGTIMAALGNRDVACVTFADALSSYPDMNPNVRQRIEGERSKARC